MSASEPASQPAPPGRPPARPPAARPPASQPASHSQPARLSRPAHARGCRSRAAVARGWEAREGRPGPWGVSCRTPPSRGGCLGDGTAPAAAPGRAGGREAEGRRRASSRYGPCMCIYIYIYIYIHTYGRFPKFHSVFFGRDPGTLKRHTTRCETGQGGVRWRDTTRREATPRETLRYSTPLYTTL